jgi:hypothetical protein
LAGDSKSARVAAMQYQPINHPRPLELAFRMVIMVALSCGATAPAWYS